MEVLAFFLVVGIGVLIGLLIGTDLTPINLEVTELEIDEDFDRIEAEVIELRQQNDYYVSLLGAIATMPMAVDPDAQLRMCIWLAKHALERGKNLPKVAEIGGES